MPTSPPIPSGFFFLIINVHTGNLIRKESTKVLLNAYVFIFKPKRLLKLNNPGIQHSNMLGTVLFNMRWVRPWPAALISLRTSLSSLRCAGSNSNSQWCRPSKNSKLFCMGGKSSIARLTGSVNIFNFIKIGSGRKKYKFIDTRKCFYIKIEGRSYCHLDFIFMNNIDSMLE